jgi:hypothetical protein
MPLGLYQHFAIKGLCLIGIVCLDNARILLCLLGYIDILPSWAYASSTLSAWTMPEYCYALMTLKYRGSQQSSREVKPKFIDSTQGE